MNLVAQVVAQVSGLKEKAQILEQTSNRQTQMIKALEEDNTILLAKVQALEEKEAISASAVEELESALQKISEISSGYGQTE